MSYFDGKLIPYKTVFIDNEILRCLSFILKKTEDGTNLQFNLITLFDFIVFYEILNKSINKNP